MSGSVHNESAGDPHNLVQARDIGHVTVNTAPPPPPRPWRPPRRHVKYTNRLRELRAVDDVLAQLDRDGRGRRALVVGRSRIGKSALLAEVVYRNEARFPDGVVAVELAGYRDREGNTDYEAALDMVLRELHVPREERPTRPGRPADGDPSGASGARETGAGYASVLRAQLERLRRATTGRRFLLVLDDVEDRSELDSFELGDGPNLVLAACDPRFHGLATELEAGAEVVELDPLTEPDGLELLREFPAVRERLRSAAAEDSARRLVALCGGLPSVIRMAAAHLSAQRDLDIDGLVRAVRAHRDAHPDVVPADAMVALHMGALTAEQAELLRRLAAYPGRVVPAELAAAVMGDAAERPLRELTEASVLRPVGASGYDTLEEVRAQARQRRASLPPDQRRAEEEAILRHLTVTQLRADSLIAAERLRLADTLGASAFTVAPADYRPPFTTAAEAGDWQDEHLRSVPDLMRLAVDLGRPDVALLLADAVWPTCYARRRLAAGETIYRYAVEVARATGHHTGLARGLCYLARVTIALGRWTEAEQQVAEAERVASDTGEELLRAVVAETRGQLCQEREPADLHAARRLIREARDIHRAHGRPRGDAMQTYQLGRLHQRCGDTADALTELAGAEALVTRRSAELASQPDDDPVAGRARHDWRVLGAQIQAALAGSRLAAGDLPGAERAAEQAREVFDTEGQPVRETRTLWVLAEVAERRGDEAIRRAVLRRLRVVAEHYHLEETAAAAYARLRSEPEA